MTTIHHILNSSTKKLSLSNITSANLDAEVLLLEALNRNRCKKSNHNNASSYNSKKLDKSWLYINNNYELNKKEENLFKNFIEQRKKNKPIAYIINKKEFFCYEFYVDENVLIPRPETELIVEEVLKILKNKSIFTNRKKQSQINIYSSSLKIVNNKFTLIDIGTGSGCIIISILNELAKYKKNEIIRDTYANDISLKSIKIAKFNAKKYKLEKNIKFITDDFENFIKKNIKLFLNQFILTANLPYIKNNEYNNLENNVKNYEPKIALLGGNEGLDLINKLIYQILNIKNSFNFNSYILIEADQTQIVKIKSLLKRKLNIINIEIIKDLRNKNRIILVKI